MDASQLPTSIAAADDTHRYATGMAVSTETLLKKMPAILDVNGPVQLLVITHSKNRVTHLQVNNATNLFREIIRR